MKLFIFLSLIFSSIVYADVKWDIPISKFNEFTDKIYLINLTVGDAAKIDTYSFCTQNGSLAVDGTKEVGSGEVKLKMLPGKKVSIQVPNTKDFLEEIIAAGAYATCEWWTPHKGEYVYIVESINGKESISSLHEKP